MIIRKYTAAPSLKRYIRHYWSMTGNAGKDFIRSRDVPDGNPEVILNFGSPFYKSEGSSTLKSPDNGVIKPQFSRSVIIEQSGQIDILGICFRPEGFYPFLRTDLFSLRNQVVPLDLFIGKDLYNQIRDEASIHDRISTLEQSLLKRLSQTSCSHPLILESLSRVNSTQDNISVRKLCRDLKISTKHLERLYKNEIGTTPKQFFDIIRIKRVVTNLNSRSVDWMELVTNFGFHDQSHLCRHFHRFTGVSPSQYLTKTDRFVNNYRSQKAHVDFIQ